MTEAPHRVVVGYDGSATSSLALRRALELARQHAPSELHVVKVLGGYDPMGKLEYARDTHKLDTKRERDELRQRAAALVEQAGGAEGVELRYSVLVGPAAKELARIALGDRADLLVVGSSSDRVVRRLVLGSVAEAVLRAAPCPVLVVREKSWKS